MDPQPAPPRADPTVVRAQRLLAERRRELEHLIDVARGIDTRDAELELARLTSALEEVNLLEICLFSPTDSLTLFG